MILDVFVYLVSLLMKLVIVPFKAITFAIPSNVMNSILDAVGYTRYFQGILPMDTIWQIVSVFFVFLGLLFALDLALFVLRFTGRTGNVDIKK